MGGEAFEQLFLEAVPVLLVLLVLLTSGCVSDEEVFVLTVENHRDEGQHIDVKWLMGDEILHEESYQIAANDIRTWEMRWTEGCDTVVVVDGNEEYTQEFWFEWSEGRGNVMLEPVGMG